MTVWHSYSCTDMATVGVKGLTDLWCAQCARNERGEMSWSDWDSDSGCWQSTVSFEWRLFHAWTRDRTSSVGRHSQSTLNRV